MKHIYKIRLLISIIVFILAVPGMFGVFYSIKLFDFQLLPVFQRVVVDFSIAALVILIALVGITFWCGRVYCSLICPFGIFQELCGAVLKVRMNKNYCEKQVNLPFKYFVGAILWGILLGGSVLAFRYVDPYTLFGSLVSGDKIGVVAVIIIAIALMLKDRVFCTNFCPVGLILGLISKVSLNKIYISDVCVSCGQCEKNCPSGCIDSKNRTVDNEMCVKCLKCLEVCPKSGIKYGIKPKSEVKFNPKRRDFIIAASALALFGGMIKAGIEIKDKVVEKIKDVILPPGAGDKERFLNKCLNCNLCIENCPNKIIQKADKEYGAVHLDYSKAPCKFDCNRCSEICPSGAIKRIGLEEKQHTRIAMAMINSDKCNECGLCVEACPVHAIIKENGQLPVLNALKCIGCGACKSACHFDVIEVFPIKEQKML